jgi:hypothetical protein
MKLRMILVAVMTVVVAASCVPMTPQARIAKDPARFAALRESEKPLVQQGRIDRGFSRDAVLLAWGSPGEVYSGFKDGKQLERWDYIGTRPVHMTHFGGGWHHGWGPYGCPHDAFDFGPDIAYLPYRYATVWFADGRVDAWERAR